MKAVVSTSKPLLDRLEENARREYWSEWEADFLPRVRRKPSVWAREVRRIAAGTSPLAKEDIPYDHAIMPHCVEQMDAADDPTIRKIVLWAPIRDGKTLSVCANIIGRTVTDDPTNIYSVHPTEDNADAFSNGDIEPMITACLDDYFVEKKSRDTGRTIEFKKFKGGWLRIFSANALTKFHGTSVGVLLLHELDKLNPEAIWKAFGRTTGFKDAIIVMESTGTLAAEIAPDGRKIYRSNIEEAYDQGDKRKWFCVCRKCGYLQTLKYDQIKPAAKLARGYYRYHCEACDCPHTPAEWRKLAANGRWYPTAGLSTAQESDIASNWQHARAIDPSVRSYWRNGFNSLLPHHSSFKSKLHEFAAEGEAAKKAGGIQLQTWKNEKAAELHNPDAEKSPPPAYQPIINGCEDYATDTGAIIPAPGLVITAMTDLHGDRLEVEWRAWSRTEESWGLGHFVLFGDTNRTEVWEEWTTHLQRPWKHTSGGTLRLSLALVDGGWRVDPILATLSRLARSHVPGVSGKIIVSKGVPQWQGVIFKNWATIKDHAKGIHIATWGAKSLIYERLKWHSAAEKPAAGFIHFGKSYSEEFIRQCVSESPVNKIINGMNIETFKNPEGNRNEALDLLVGGLAAFRRRKWDFDTIERILKEEAETLNGMKVVTPTQPRARTRSSFVNSWR